MNCFRHSRKIFIVSLTLLVLYVLWAAVSLEKRSAKSLVIKDEPSQQQWDYRGQEDVSTTATAITHHPSTTAAGVGSRLVERPSLAVPADTSPLSKLRRTVLELNAKETVQNAGKFPPLTDEGLVIVVQVHKRLGYLRHLLRSLQEAKGIEDVLLVISHDYYDEQINEAVREITFCKVLQIFYPHSAQLFPDTFPGPSKNDCPRDISKAGAVAMNCTNALHPDTYGHYREAHFTAIKHHWWWKINTVFDHLTTTSTYSGYIILLEEDHFLSPDFVDVTRKLISLVNLRCADCDLINLGTYSLGSYHDIGNKVTTEAWNAGKNNMGFGMNRHTWNMLKTCAKEFCTHDDYNWDWTLQSLGYSCLKRTIKVMVIKAPRVFHIGSCGGVHHSATACNPDEAAQTVRSHLTSQKPHLFPSSLDLYDNSNMPPASRGMNYGGWGDLRDHNLCMSYSTKGAS
ncbi:hypothetical protein EMCRGX_G003725 [Ephydatia muelleri]